MNDICGSRVTAATSICANGNDDADSTECFLSESESVAVEDLQYVLTESSWRVLLDSRRSDAGLPAVKATGLQLLNSALNHWRICFCKQKEQKQPHQHKA